MAYVELPLIAAGSLARNISVGGISTAATGPVGDVYMMSMYHDNITVAAVCSANAQVDIEACCCVQSVVQAGGGIWVPILALSGVGTTPKMGSFNSPLTAIRVNVKVAQAGTLSLAIRTDSPNK